MRNHPAKIAIRVVAMLTPATLNMWATPTPAQEQGRPVYVPPVLERRETEMSREREARQREELRRGVGRSRARAANQRYVQAVIAQVTQDFERIQIARNEIVRTIGNGLDYKFVSEVTGEIKKSASRLEENLALPEAKEDEKRVVTQGELNEDQIRVALQMLCDRIESFVKNPLFESPGVLDVEHSTKASSDLESILALSNTVKKSAERLKKLRQPKP
jgi:hypothetical protein